MRRELEGRGRNASQFCALANCLSGQLEPPPPPRAGSKKTFSGREKRGEFHFLFFYAEKTGGGFFFKIIDSRLFFGEREKIRLKSFPDLAIGGKNGRRDGGEGRGFI